MRNPLIEWSKFLMGQSAEQLKALGVRSPTPSISGPKWPKYARSKYSPKVDEGSPAWRRALPQWRRPRQYELEQQRKASLSGQA